MSTNTYGGQITGCIIKEKYIDGFIRRYLECHPEEFEDIESPLEKYEDLESRLVCNGGIKRSSACEDKPYCYAQMYTDDSFYNTAEMYHIGDQGDWVEDLDMPFVLVEMDRSVATKFVLNGEYYKSKEEMIDEIRAKVGSYLPEDFDYEENIGDVVFAVVC